MSQLERFLYIDMRARFLGEVKRQDLTNRFAIQSAAATRDLAEYRYRKPDNLVYRSRTKSYLRSDAFVPMYRNITTADVMAWLCPGPGQTGLMDPEVRMPMERDRVVPGIDLEVLANVSRSIHQRTPLAIDYLSPLSGSGQFEIVPHALAEVGGFRLLRAFERRRQMFTSFGLNWITGATALTERIEPDEEAPMDSAWHTVVTLELVPHPDNVPYPLGLEREHGLVDGVWRVPLKAPLVKFWLDGHRVDATEDHKLRGPQLSWWLRNAPSIVSYLAQPADDHGDLVRR
ncbi:MAG: WYL domain-containing protein [Leptothrix sp. (in: b-proteobacteria)]